MAHREVHLYAGCGHHKSLQPETRPACDLVAVGTHNPHPPPPRGEIVVVEDAAVAVVGWPSVTARLPIAEHGLPQAGSNQFEQPVKHALRVHLDACLICE